jgi:hypothetical protein
VVDVVQSWPSRKRKEKRNPRSDSHFLVKDQP